MNEQEKRGLNEKLARWAWPDAKKIEIYHGRLCVDWFAKAGWTYKGVLFTESLDAQAKWLWPKAGQKWGFAVQFCSDGDGSWDCIICTDVGGADDTNAESLAEASAIAIGSLIDAQNHDRISQLAEAQSQHNDGWAQRRAQEKAND